MHFTTLLLALATTTSALATHRHTYTVSQSHLEILRMRHANSHQVQRNALVPRLTTCLDRDARIVFHDENAAELAICGGISGNDKRSGCGRRQGGTSESESVGEAGSARFELRAVREGATIEITKLDWEACVRAARDVCPTGSLEAVCRGGASKGDLRFRLVKR